MDYLSMQELGGLLLSLAFVAIQKSLLFNFSDLLRLTCATDVRDLDKSIT